MSSTTRSRPLVGLQVSLFYMFLDIRLNRYLPYSRDLNRSTDLRILDLTTNSDCRGINVARPRVGRYERTTEAHLRYGSIVVKYGLDRTLTIFVGRDSVLIVS